MTRSHPFRHDATASTLAATTRAEAGPFSIGELARQTGCQPETVRYYERIGLLGDPARSEGGQRRYDARALERLMFIRHARDFGFPVAAVRELLALSDQPDRPCDEVDALARRHLDEVTSRIERLEALRAELLHMITQCAGGKVERCRIIEVLADHRLCGQREGHDGAEVLK